jgi:hypothetical protein
MKIDEHVVLGLLVGIFVGLQYGHALVTYMPFIVIGTVLLLYKQITAKK